MSDPDHYCQQALARLRLRDEAGAAQWVERALASQPDHAASLHLAALLAGRAGRDGDCIALLHRAIASGTPAQQESSGLLLAAAHERAGRMAHAEQAWRDVLTANTACLQALLGLALALNRQGRPDEAAPFLRRALAVSAPTMPEAVLAHAALAAVLLPLGNLAEAEIHARAALALAPDNRDALANLAVICNARGDGAQAEALCRKALILGEDAALHNTLGVALRGQENSAQAEQHFEQALALSPGLTDARYNLAMLRKDQGRTDEAIALLRQIVAQAPHLAAARVALCMAHLPPLFDKADQIASARAAYSDALADLEAWADQAGAAALAPGVGAVQPFYLAYQGDPDPALQRRYGALVCRAMAAAYPPVPLAKRARPGERIRIGIVCGHLRDHSVWRLPTKGWVEGLDRRHVELLAYHTSARHDAETDRAQALFDRFAQGPFSTESWRARIAADRPHVLIWPEIGMDPMAARLAAMRLAPLQYASWGHPATSGYPTIDGFFSSDAMEPVDAQQHYTEHLIRLPGLSTPFAPPPATGRTPQRAALGIAPDAVVYWSGQSPYKYQPGFDLLFPTIARRVPESCFIFSAFPDSPSLTRRFADRLDAAFRAEGVAPEGRCLILPRLSAEDFRAAMRVADVVLDNPGWSGCNSLVEALVHGLPVVTMPGETMPSRHGAAVLRHLGLTEMVATDLDAYVDLAVALGRDPARRATLRHTIAQRLPRLASQEGVAALQAHMLATCHALPV